MRQSTSEPWNFEPDSLIRNRAFCLKFQPIIRHYLRGLDISRLGYFSPKPWTAQSWYHITIIGSGEQNNLNTKHLTVSTFYEFVNIVVNRISIHPKRWCFSILTEIGDRWNIFQKWNRIRNHNPYKIGFLYWFFFCQTCILIISNESQIKYN